MALPVSLDRPAKDNFNAAQYGAIAMNLNYELDYLIPRKAQLTLIILFYC